MSRLEFYSTSGSQAVVESLYRDLEHRIVASPPGLCPVDLAASFFETLSCPDLRQMCPLPRRIAATGIASGGRAARQHHPGHLAIH